MDLWAYTNGAHLDFIRPGSSVENSYIENLNGKLRDDRLNVEVLFTLSNARQKLANWRRDYNHRRPHSAPADRTRQSGGLQAGSSPPRFRCLRIDTGGGSRNDHSSVLGAIERSLKQMAPKRILTDDHSHTLRQTIEAATHVGCLGRQPYPRRL